MEDYLKVITPHLHPDLVSPEVLSHIQELAQILSPFREILLECRLGAGQSQVDLSVNLPYLTQPLPEGFLIHPVWRAFQDFYQEWVDPTSSLHQGVKNLWLEFDLNGSPSPVPIPCVFLSLNPQTVNQFQGLISIALSLLNHPISPLVESNLRLCADSLPDGARITDVGAMLSRPAQGVRVNITRIPPEQLLDYLEQIGWTDPLNTLSGLVSTLADFVDYMLLTLDVGETVHPRIGLECYLKKQPLHEPRWQLFLEDLVKKGLCSPAKRDAILAWPGLSQRTSQPELKPSNLTWGTLFLQSMVSSVYWRMINHIKIVYQPSRPLEAKGYLALGHRWLCRDIDQKTA